MKENYRFTDKVRFDAPEIEYHNFIGLYEDENCEKETELPERILGNKTVYAKYEPKTYSITLNDENGNEIDEFINLEHQYGSETKLPTIEVAEQYIFDGWQVQDGVFTLTVGSNVHEDTEFSPVVTPKTYPLSYELNGGYNNRANPIAYTYGDSLDLQAPYKEGCNFGGWFTDPQFTNEVYSINETTYGNITLYALWLKPAEIVGTEDLSEGSGGRIDIPSGNFHAKLYWGAGTGGDQAIVDAQNSAYIYNYMGKKLIIGDHAYQGFNCIASADVAYLTQGGELRTLYKASQYGGYNTGDGLKLDDGRWAEDVGDGAYCLYTCNGDRVTITFWN